MPEPRTIEGRERQAPATTTYEPWSHRPEIAQQRRRRGKGGAVPVEVRNGLPDFKPYVYRGTGHDIYEEAESA